MKTASATAATRAAITGTVAALSDRELLAQTSNLARVERHLQGAIIDHLAEIEARSLFLRRGFASLFEYAVRELGYSDAAAGRRIAAMRLCADNPHTRERLRDGSLSLSAAAELQWAFACNQRRSGAAYRATAGAGCSRAAEAGRGGGRQEHAAGQADAGRPGPGTGGGGRSRAPARQRPLRAEGAHRRGVSARPGAAYGLAVARGPAHDGGTARRPAGASRGGRRRREALDRHDPSRRCPRTGSRPADAHAHAAPTPAAEPDRRTASPPKQTARPAVSATSTAQTRPGCDGHAAPAPKSRASGRAIPAAVKREIWQRDRGRCRYVDPHTRRRCTSRHLLQIDHVLPYGLGGGSDPGNLRLLCHAHHRHRHRHRSASAVSPTRNPEHPEN